MIGSRVAYQVHICTKNYSYYLYISFLILFLFQTAEPRGVEVDIPTSESSLPTKSQEDQNDDD